MNKTNNDVCYSLLNEIIHNKTLTNDEIQKIIFIIKDLEEIYESNKGDVSLKYDIQELYELLKKNL